MMGKRRTGTREWSQHSANLFLGCEHDCRYCYARCSALRFGRIQSAEESYLGNPLGNQYGEYGESEESFPISRKAGTYGRSR